MPEPDKPSDIQSKPADLTLGKLNQLEQILIDAQTIILRNGLEGFTFDSEEFNILYGITQPLIAKAIHETASSSNSDADKAARNSEIRLEYARAVGNYLTLVQNGGKINQDKDRIIHLFYHFEKRVDVKKLPERTRVAYELIDKFIGRDYIPENEAKGLIKLEKIETGLKRKLEDNDGLDFKILLEIFQGKGKHSLYPYTNPTSLNSHMIMAAGAKSRMALYEFGANGLKYLGKGEAATFLEEMNKPLM
jgi:hypothetical protein